MSAKIFYDKDASLAHLEDKTIVFIGYGNQGRAQCLNLKDTISRASLNSPPKIIATSLKDHYGEQARKDGVNFTTDFASAASQADILFPLSPDQFQPSLFNDQLASKLKPNVCIVVASGYNHFYSKLSIPSIADVVMLAPRMIGTSNGTGSPDAICLSLALGIGALKAGAIQSSCREETLIDLFAEQALFPTVIKVWEEAYSTLKRLGASDEALVYELWKSKEAAEIFEEMANDGFIKQLVHHSSVSQYRQLKGSLNYDEAITNSLRKEFSRVEERRILNGAFEREFSTMEEGEGGVQGQLDKLYEQAEKSELAEGERKVMARLADGLISLLRTTLRNIPKIVTKPNPQPKPILCGFAIDCAPIYPPTPRSPGSPSAPSAKGEYIEASELRTSADIRPATSTASPSATVLAATVASIDPERVKSQTSGEACPPISYAVTDSSTAQCGGGTAIGSVEDHISGQSRQDRSG